jgi:uncharacterized protein (UPF0332 family)
VTEDNKRANVAAELARSDESLRAAVVLLEANLLRDAESRLYYAAYHAAMALLFTEGLEPRSHTGVSALLGLHFVKPGRLDPADGRLFARLQKYRIEADYAREFVLTRAALEEDLGACRALLARVRLLIASAVPGTAETPGTPHTR